MRILILGGTGVVGRAVIEALRVDTRGLSNELVTTSRKTVPDLNVNQETSIQKYFESLKKGPRFDAVVCAFGEVPTAPWERLEIPALEAGLRSKLLAQIAVTRYAEPVLRDRGSITLTTGITSEHFAVAGLTKTVINRALEGFVETVALELPRGIRINAVSPGLIEESAVTAAPFFPGIAPVTPARVGLEFQKSVFGIQTGKTLRGY